MSDRPPSPDTTSTHQPGGMARVPGNRTPRRVQWASAVNLDGVTGRTHENALESDTTSNHELDEAGLDPAAFQTLTHALEHHRSSSASPLPVQDSPKVLLHETNVPGEAFIEPDERAGLPMLRPEENEGRFSDSEARAADVVRAHSVNPFSRRFFRRRSRSTPARPNKREDTEMAAAADTTPPMTRVQGEPPPHSPDSPSHSFLDLPGRRLADVSKALHLPEPRPSRERNAAGVWGSLIASTTGTLVGAAAPTHSGIAPDIKRPGYHLSRYSLDGSVRTAPQHPTQERPRSMLANGGMHRSSSSSPHTTLRELPKRGRISHPSTSHTTTDSEGGDEKEGLSTDSEGDDERAKVNTSLRKITRHISSLISRQTFILKLARAMMMFGGPTHRLASPDAEHGASFDDDVTSTSNVKLIRQSSALDLGKVQDAYKVYWRVIHDDMSVTDAVSFNGSLIDSLISFPLSALLVSVQILSVRNELYSNVFEITIATLLSFLSGALAQTHKFCYSAVASSSVVLILPGFIVLCGSLELSSRNIVSGAVRLCYALVYSLFLGFGLAIGAQIYEKMTGLPIFAPEDYQCAQSHSNAPWFRKTPSHYWAFLTVPMFALFLSLRNQAPWYRKELAVLVAISCVGWVTNHFVGTRFPGQSDISAAVGYCRLPSVSLRTVYGRIFNGNAFVVMITGILFQLPSGLWERRAQASGNSTSYLSGFQVALQLVSVSIGLTLVLVFPIQSRKRKSGVFSL
ncbi:hypothetical protein H4582DRAFT_2112404 [Lactarius indigo]|nr:hypothetical protein H4582DRAFT_2112404 [Lactarius indigo]